MLLQKSELAMDELVGVAIAVIALKYYVSAMFQIKYITEYFGAHYTQHVPYQRVHSDSLH